MKKNAKLSNTLIFFEKKISKTWTPFIAERKKKSFCLFFQKKPLRNAIIQNMSYVCKKNVKHDKNQKLVYFIFRVEAS